MRTNAISHIAQFLAGAYEANARRAVDPGQALADGGADGDLKGAELRSLPEEHGSFPRVFAALEDVRPALNRPEDCHAVAPLLRLFEHDDGIRAGRNVRSGQNADAGSRPYARALGATGGDFPYESE
jgi:hypothetical protein